MPEEVDHPEWYGGEDNPYEVIKVLRAWDLNLAKGFCWGNLIKYTARAGKKGVAAVADRQKAEWYAAELVSIEAQLMGQEMEAEKTRYKTATFNGVVVKIDWKERTWRIEGHNYVSGGSVGGGGGGGGSSVHNVSPAGPGGVGPASVIKRCASLFGCKSGYHDRRCPLYKER